MKRNFSQRKRTITTIIILLLLLLAVIMIALFLKNNKTAEATTEQIADVNSEEKNDIAEEEKPVEESDVLELLDQEIEQTQQVASTKRKQTNSSTVVPNTNNQTQSNTDTSSKQPKEEQPKLVYHLSQTPVKQIGKGDVIEYKVTVTNSSTLADAKNVKIVLPIPNGTELVKVEDAQIESNQVIWLADVNRNSTIEKLLTVKVVVDKATIDSQATVSENQTNKTTITLVDKTAPVIEVIDPNRYFMQVGTSYIEKGYSAVDNWDGDLTNKVTETYRFLPKGSSNWQDPNKLDTSKLGTYKITYHVKDSSGNETVATRVVEIVDNISPVITVKEESKGTDPYYTQVSFKLYDNHAVKEVEVNGTVMKRTPNNWSDLNYVSVGKNGGIEGKNVVILRDLAGNETSYTFYLDTKAPEASITYSNKNGSQVTKEDVIVTLTANEPIKQIEGWEKQNDTTYTKTYSKNGKYQVEIEDLAGNKTSISYEVKRIDRIAPEIIGIEEGAYYNKEVSYTIKEQSISQIIIDGKIYNEKNAPKVISKEGRHTIKVIDKAGNESKEISFMIDTTKPVITVKEESKGTDPYYTQVSFKLYDNRGIKEVEVNGTVMKRTPNNWSDLNYVSVGKNGGIEGRNTVILRDLAGNETSYIFYLDTKAPEASITYSNKNGSQVTKEDVIVTLTANEPIKQIEGWEKQNDTTYTKTYSKNGKYQVEIEDLAGNKTSISYEVKRIDRIAPEIIGIEEGAYYNKEVSYTIKEQSISQIIIDGKIYNEKNAPKVISKEGRHTIKVIDKAGNESKEISFMIDTTKPVITVKEESKGTDSHYREVSFKLYDNQAVKEVELNGTVMKRTPSKWSDLNNIAIGKNGAIEGKNIVILRDLAGNETSYTFYLDTKAPEASITYSNKNGSQVTKEDVIVTLTANEPIKQIEGWEKQNDTTYTKTYSKNGKYQVEIEDLAGNKTSISYEVKRIDKEKPVIKGIENGKTYNKEVSYTVEEQNISQIIIDEVSYQEKTAPKTISGNGTHTIQVKDKAGNVSDLLSFVIEME